MAYKIGGKSVHEIIDNEPVNVAAIIHDDPFGTIRRHKPGLDNTFGWIMVWLDQYLDELSALLRKQKRLRRKLQDPRLADSPNRPAAVKRADKLDRDIIEKAQDVAWEEARCDRYWQAMSHDQRMVYASAWDVSVDTERLIGLAWTIRAFPYRWPTGARPEWRWFRTLPIVLQDDLREYRVTRQHLGIPIYPQKEQPCPPDPW